MYKKALLLLALLMLASCASSIKSTAISKTTGLTEGQGAVAVQVINNAERLSVHHTNWTEVIVVRIDNMAQLKQQAIDAAKQKAAAEKRTFDPSKVDWDLDVYSLQPSTAGVIGSQLFVGSMPAGEYMISSLYAYYTDGNMSSWVTMPVRGAAGLFSVKEKQLTSLGALVFQPLLDVKSASFWSNSSSTKAFVTRVEEQNLEEYVFANYPQLKAQVDTKNILGWKADDLSVVRDELSQLAMKNAWGDKSLLLNQYGSGLIAAKFGQYHWLDKDAKWHKGKLPTTAQLASVLETPSSIAIGAERGQVFIAKELAGDWRRLTPVSAQEAIVWMGKGIDGYYALTQNTRQYTVYQFSDIETPWQKIGQYSAKAESVWVQNGGVFAFVDKAGTLQLLNDNSLHHYDNAKKTWTTTKASAMRRVSQLADGSLLGLEISQWDGIGDQVISTDDGKSWQSLSRTLGLFGDRDAEASLPVKLADGTVVTTTRVRKADKSSDLYIVSNDGTKVGAKAGWKEHHKVLDGCYSMLPELSQQHTLYFICKQGDVMQTSDFGGSWQLAVDIDVPAMQRSFDKLLDALKQQSAAEAAAEQTP